MKSSYLFIIISGPMSFEGNLNGIPLNASYYQGAPVQPQFQDPSQGNYDPSRQI